MMLKRVEAGHFQVALRGVECDLLKTWETASRAIRVIARRIKDRRLQRAMSMIAAIIGVYDMEQVDLPASCQRVLPMACRMSCV